MAVMRRRGDDPGYTVLSVLLRIGDDRGLWEEEEVTQTVTVMTFQARAMMKIIPNTEVTCAWPVR